VVAHLLVPGGEQGAVLQFDSGGVAQIAVSAVAGNRDGFAPGFAVVGADARLVAERLAPMTVTHQQTAIAQSQQVRRQSPDADRVWHAPGFAAVGGLGLECLASVGRVIVSNLHDDRAVGGLDGVQFVVF
ncbi:uncharacterized protein METZ01_LOCUS272359, partial [marine metagenome]